MLRATTCLLVLCVGSCLGDLAAGAPCDRDDDCDDDFECVDDRCVVDVDDGDGEGEDAGEGEGDVGEGEGEGEGGEGEGEGDVGEGEGEGEPAPCTGSSSILENGVEGNVVIGGDVEGRVFLVAWVTNTPTPTLQVKTVDVATGASGAARTVAVGSGGPPDPFVVGDVAYNSAADEWAVAWAVLDGTPFVNVQRLQANGTPIGTPSTPDFAIGADDDVSALRLFHDGDKYFVMLSLTESGIGSGISVRGLDDAGLSIERRLDLAPEPAKFGGPVVVRDGAVWFSVESGSTVVNVAPISRYTFATNTVAALFDPEPADGVITAFALPHADGDNAAVVVQTQANDTLRLCDAAACTDVESLPRGVNSPEQVDAVFIGDDRFFVAGLERFSAGAGRYRMNVDTEGNVDDDVGNAGGELFSPVYRVDVAAVRGAVAVAERFPGGTQEALGYTVFCDASVNP